MAVNIKNLNELEKILDKRLKLAIEMTQNEIYKVIQKHILDYYNEKVFLDHANSGRLTNIPAEYERTYSFFNGLVKPEVLSKNGEYFFTVTFDTDRMDSLYKAHSADEVLDMMNRGFHTDKEMTVDGVYEPSENIYAQGNFWDDAIIELGGFDGIIALFKKNIRKVGIPIK